jgi:hypothetical protein
VRQLAAGLRDGDHEAEVEEELQKKSSSGVEARW